LDERSEKPNSEKSTKERREVIARQVLEAFRQGAAPAVLDAQLLTLSWGIRLEDVTYDKVRIWHGTQDANTPVQI
jgi:regulator of protease activity HflC (stomatin/prohibitin superfamily)